MIYQKLRPLADNSQVINSDLVKNLINEALEAHSQSMQQIVEDLIFLTIDHRGDIDAQNSFANGFEYLFSKGLTWKILEDIEVASRKDENKKNKFINLNILNLKRLIKPAFEKNFMDEFINNPQELKQVAFKMFKSSLCTDERLLSICERLDIPNNQDYLSELILATRTFPQMKQLSKVLSLDHWRVITKESGIETLLPIYVWQMENAYLIDKQKTSFEERKQIFLDGKSFLNNISTAKTPNIDFKSRFVFASCNISNDKNYSELLKDLDIKSINLECVDSGIKSEKQTLKERLLQFGKIKLVNKFEKKKNIGIEIGSLITASPTKPYLISNKKAFVKQFVSNLDDGINYTSLLESVIESKNRRFGNALYEIKCYLPLKKEYLNAQKSYWEGTKVTDSFFIDINDYDYGQSSTVKSFSNLFSWLEDKDVNWTKKTSENNYLLTDTIITTMQLANDIRITQLSDSKGLLLKIYKALSHVEKAEVLLQLKDNWDNIWDFANSNKHKQDILNTPYKKASNVFNFMKDFMEDCLADHIRLDAHFFDEKWEKIKKDIEPYVEHDSSAKRFLILSNTVELNSTLSVSENKRNIKSIKL